jgi:hypothetical protein
MRRTAFIPVVLSTSSRAACIVDGMPFRRLSAVLAQGPLKNKRRYVLLNVLIFRGQLVCVLSLQRSPWLSNVRPFPLRITSNPFLKITILVLGKEGALPPHDRIVEVQPDVQIAFVG